MKKTLFLTLASLFLLVLNFASANEQLPDESIYHFESDWLSHNGQTVHISELQGPPRLFAFVYTYCEHTCPVIITRIKSVLNELTVAARNQTIVTLVTLDPERDTVERVAEYMKSRDLDDQAWQVLIGTPDDVLTFAALFNVRYKPMGESDIAHSNVITLVDQQGVILHQLKGLDQSPDDLLKQLEELALQ